MTLPSWIWAVIDLWIMVRRYSSPFGGRLLPCAGSPGEQPAALMDAMALLDSMDPPRNG